MLNSVSLTCPSLQILSKIQAGVFLISGFLVNPLKTKIVITLENSRTSYDMDMKLGPVANLNKRNMAMSKKFDDDAVWEN